MDRLWRLLRFIARSTRRLAILVVGLAVMVVGVILIPAPGPGWLVVFTGLAILATEFTWAELLLDRAKRQAVRAKNLAVSSVVNRRRVATIPVDRFTAADAVTAEEAGVLPNYGISGVSFASTDEPTGTIRDQGLAGVSFATSDVAPILHGWPDGGIGAHGPAVGDAPAVHGWPIGGVAAPTVDPWPAGGVGVLPEPPNGTPGAPTTDG